jgi:hypothetical protein
VRIRILVVVVMVVVASMFAPAAASAGLSRTPDRPSPDWYTPQLHAQVLAAGADGVQVAQERLNTACPGLQLDPGVSAGGCIISPAGCTANFIFTRPGTFYVGTAAHCTEGVGDPVVMQVDTTTIAEVGTVVQRTAAQRPGEDFALIEISEEIEARWGVNPAIPLIGGPNGIYSGCAIRVVKHYGHGYGVLVAQGKPSAGVATNWYDDGYGWLGAALPGDSGSPVVLLDGRAAGNLTHLVIDTGRYRGSVLAGMRITRILQFAGVELVNADGSTTGPEATSCG